MCLAEGDFSTEESQQFREFCELLQSVFHFEYHRTLEQLKDLYAPINPDRDTRVVGIVAEETTSFTDVLDRLLNSANYEKLSQAALNAAFEESSLFQLKLNVDFDEYEEVLLFTRGESEHTETVKTLFGLISREVTFTNFDRVVLYIRFKEGVSSDLAQGKPGATMLKLFQNVPRADVEMLFPNTRLGMRTIDKLMVGVPALIGAGAIITTKVGASLLLLVSLLGFYLGMSTEQVELDEARLLAILAGIGGLGSYIWKQFSNFRNRKLLFMQSLTQNLYFKNLDNNAGVFYRLVDDAEEEECKEAILAYYFLLRHSKSEQSAAISGKTLDEKIELWFRDQWQMDLDFEIDDGLHKLKRLGLVGEKNDELQMVSLAEACEILDKRWDNYFQHANEEG